MADQTLSNICPAPDLHMASEGKMSVEQRKALVRTMAERVMGQSDGEDSAAIDVLEVLARDPEWSVRLEVARTVHLLDDPACSRLVALLRTDSNIYVRNNAQRGLLRQRRACQATTRRRGEQRGYSGQIDALARQYGRTVANKVQQMADRRYAVLVSAVSHDIRSILTTLSANAAALADNGGEDCRARSILEDVKLLERTVEAMEQFSKPLPDHRCPENLREMIDEAVAKARAGVDRQGYDSDAVSVEVGQVPTVRPLVSRRLIVLALTYAIQNAIESFAQPQEDALSAGVVDIEVTVDGYEMHIRIHDNGSGVEPEVLAELQTFAPSGPNKSKRNSSGWGLPLTNRYISAHDGSVSIHSELGRGTTVTMILPMGDRSGEDDE